MKRLLLGLVMITALTACGGGGGSSANIGGNTTNPPSTNSATIEFINSSQRTIYGIYMSASTSPTWGANLIAGSSLAPSNSITMYASEPDCNTNIDISISITAGNPQPEDSSGETAYQQYIECGVAYTYTATP